MNENSSPMWEDCCIVGEEMRLVSTERSPLRFGESPFDASRGLNPGTFFRAEAHDLDFEVVFFEGDFTSFKDSLFQLSFDLVSATSKSDSFEKSKFSGSWNQLSPLSTSNASSLSQKSGQKSKLRVLLAIAWSDRFFDDFLPEWALERDTPDIQTDIRGRKQRFRFQSLLTDRYLYGLEQ